MKFLKYLLYSTFVLTMVMGLNACKDDFSDEDFFNAQKDAAAAADAQLQADITTLAAFNFIVDVSGAPSVGLSITMTPLDNAAGTVFTGTTGSNGEVSFADVPTGTSVIDISGTDVVSTRVVINFNNNATTTNGSRRIVIRRTESAAVEVFSTVFSTSGSTAIIKGNVTAELDLTNTTPEIPASLSIFANFYENLLISGPSSGSVNSITLIGQGDYGSSTVDSVGNYSMVVPVSEFKGSTTNTTPLPVELLIPSFTADQMVAYTRRDGVEVGPTMELVLTGFGPNHAPNAVPQVPGLLASFPAPPVSTGSGFALTLAPLGTRLGNFNTAGDYTQNDAFTGDTTMVSYELNFSNPGSEYMRSPDVTLSGGGPSAANQQKMYASLAGRFNSITTDGGTGYVANDVVTLTLNMWAVLTTDDADTALVFIDATNTITADATTALLPTTVDISAFTGTGFDADFVTDVLSPTRGYRVMRYEVAFSAGSISGLGTATGTATALAEVSRLQLVETPTKPSYYTSAPTITFTGGTSPVSVTTQATASISNFRTFFTVTPDNTSTVAYNVLPQFVDIKYEDGYAENDGSPPLESDDVFTNSGIYIGMNDDIANIYQTPSNDGSIVSHLMVDVSGNLVWDDPNYAAITGFMGGPTTYEHVGAVGPSIPAMADFWNEGANTYIDPVTGEILAMNTTNGTAAFGSGYTGIFNIALALTFPGLPGTGANIQLTSSSSGQWDGGYSILSGGSGHLPNVNQEPESPSGSQLNNSIFVDVRPGGTYVRDLDYGTGERLVDVEGFEGN